MTQGSGDGLAGGRYRLVSEVGRGGMGAVWKARDERLDRLVAIKQLTSPPGIAGQASAQRIARVRREAKLAARLDHPGIVRVHDVIDWDGIPAIVMEYVDGRSLATVLHESGPLPVAEVARIGSALIDALRHAHDAGVVHRDLKPDNILLSGARVVITDFGIARPLEDATPLTATQAVIGTPAYMSPEQIEGKQATPASDLWSLGVTLYYAIEGALPFQGETVAQVFVSVLTQPMRPALKAGPLASLLEALLTKLPDNRATIESAAEQLASIGNAGRDGASREPVVEADTETARPRRENADAEAREQALHTRKLRHHTQEATTVLEPHGTRQDVEPLPAHHPWRRALVIALPCALIAAGIATAVLVPTDPRPPTASATRPAAKGTRTPAPAVLSATLVNPDKMYTNNVDSLTFGANGRILAVGGLDGNAYVWNTSTGKLTATLDTPRDGTADSVSVAFTPDGTAIATCENGSIYVGGYYDDNGRTELWNTTTGKATGTVVDPDGHGNYITAVAFAPNGATLATGDTNGDAYLRNLGTGKLTGTLSDPDGTLVGFVTFAPDGTTLATGDSTGNTYLWNTATRHLTATLTDPAQSSGGTMTAVAFAPDSTTVATADSFHSDAYGDKGNTYLWNATTGKLTATLTDPGGTGVSSVAFAPDGTTLAVADDNGDVYLWNTSTRKIIAALTDPAGVGLEAVAFAPDGTLATGNSVGSTYLWRFPG